MKEQNDDYKRLEKAYNTIVSLEKKMSTLQKEGLNEPIAVIGIGCKFPGGVNSPYEFYQMLKRGDSAIGDIPVQRWNFQNYDRELKKRIYCLKGGFLKDVYKFDPLFFNISPLEADYMDPQQRIFLETCWKAFEDAGYTKEKLQNVPCGVFAGVVSNDYYGYLDSIPHNPEAYEVIGNYNSMLSARISYYLNLKGPAITIDTACSSSAVAIHLACKAIQSGESEIALAGGVTLYLTPRPYLLMSEALMLSKKGKCFAFDERADGFIPGEGCGVVVLKSLKKAIQDGDHIYGVIRASGINQDGRSNGITAPNALSQSQLQLSVFKKHGINPEDISYIETHGTGTELGDPIEIQALTDAFRKYTNEKRFCAIGSVKTNIGHLQGAAGVASLIKVLLEMESRVIFPSINYEKENPHLNLKETPFYVNTKLQEWKTGNSGTRIAAINAFGFSGTNAHLIIEEYKAKSSKCYKGPYLIPISANSKAVLKEYIEELKQFLQSYENREIYNQICNCVADVLCVNMDEVVDNFDWQVMGGDAVTLQQLVERLNNTLNISLNIAELLTLQNIRQLTDHVMSMDNTNNKFMASLAATFQMGRNTMKIKQLFAVSSRNDLPEQFDLFLQDKPYSSSIVLSKEAQLCKENWENGKEVDWELLYTDGKPSYISAPTYPFDRKEYFLKPNTTKKSDACMKKISEKSCYEYMINRSSDELTTHKVKNNAILPAAFLVELILQAASKELGEQVNLLKDVKFKNPLYISEKNKKLNIVTTTDKLQRSTRCELTDENCEAKCDYSLGKAFVSELEISNIPIMKSDNLIKTYDRNAWYSFTEKKGFKYGKNYQLIDEVKIYDEVATASLHIEPLKETKQDEFILNPYVLDAAIQPVIAIVDRLFPKCNTFLPYHISELYKYKELTGKVVSYVRISKMDNVNSSESNCCYFDLYLLDVSNNSVIIKCKNIAIKILNLIEKEETNQLSNLKHNDGMQLINSSSLKSKVAKEVIESHETVLSSIYNYISNIIAEVLRIPKESIELDYSFPSMGVDSFIALKLIGKMEMDLGRLPKTVLFEYFTIEKLGKYLYDNFKEKFIKNNMLKEETEQEIVVTETNKKSIIIPEEKLDDFPEEKKNIERIIKQYEMEGLAYARKEIAPEIFLGSKSESFFYIAQRNNMILAFLYNGPEEKVDELASELTDYCSSQDKNVYFLIRQKLNSINKRKLVSVSIGVLQRLQSLPDQLSGKKYRHLRYAIKNFEESGECFTKEYKINSDKAMDQEILSLIDQWCAKKKMVNNYIYKVKEQIITKTFSDIYRFFVTYLDNQMVSVIIITPIPACKGYLMDLEFYTESMPLGGLEYSIKNIYKQLRLEGITNFSLGATFGVMDKESENTDSEWINELQELWQQEIFDGSGNYQFKNKFRTENVPLNLYRFSDCSNTLIDIIMFIAQPVGVEAQVQVEVEKKALKSDINTNSVTEPATSLDYSILEGVHYNTLFVTPDKVKYDLLTDSWSQLAGVQANISTNFEESTVSDYDLISSLQAFFPFTYILPVASGRYAESLLFGTISKNKRLIAQNLLFPTTASNQKSNGFKPLEIPTNSVYNFDCEDIYRGNIDISKLEDAFKNEQIAYVVVEMENNASGGAPVSLKNISLVRGLCNKYKASLIIDATRIMENALLIIEQGDSNKSPIQLTNELLSYADYVVGSLTKDFGTTVGGIIATNDIEIVNAITERMAIQGSGLNIRDKQLICSALEDKERIVNAIIKRKKLVHKLGESIKDYFSIVKPYGGHCILIDVMKFKELENYKYPIQSFLNWLFLETGIRAGIHRGGLDNGSSLNRLVRVTVPVGCKEEDIDEIIRRFKMASQKAKDFRDITLVKNGDANFGSIKNKYKAISESHRGNNEKFTNVNSYLNKEDDIDNKNLVAIVGVSGSYPGARNVSEFWNNLKNGKDCITEIPKDRWDYRLFYHPDKRVMDKNPCKWGGFLNDIDKFDAGFFQITPYEAEKMDPQQRLFLQTAWHVIEDAGYALTEFKKVTESNVGVFVGATWSEYSYLADANKGFYPEVNLGSIATRVSYYLDLQGPTLTVDTHCSSSMSALYLAYEAIKNGTCKAAIAGGVNLSIHPNKYQFAKYFLSPTGRCHSFGADGDGYVPGEGVGAVLLKPLKDAINSNDHIYGIISGALMRHGGKTAGVTVPNPKSQAELIIDTYSAANINPETISYIEAHGTGTDLGDPIEIQGLSAAFRRNTDKKNFCAIGSVKSNIGHLEAASGISQLTKILLQLKHRKIVPSLHSERLNPNIDFEETPFYVQQRLTDWDILETIPYIRRAAMSSFGAGGVNCHCVIEEFPNEYKTQKINSGQKILIPFSAKNKNAVREYIKEFHQFLISEEELPPLLNIAYTLQVGRESFKERVVFIVSDKKELIELCNKFINGSMTPQILTGSAKSSINLINLEEDKDITENLHIMTKMAEQWVNGAKIDWMALYNYKQITRVALPTYPFTKESYWAPSKLNGLKPKNMFMDPVNDISYENVEVAIEQENVQKIDSNVVYYKKVLRAIEVPENDKNKNQIVIFDVDENLFEYLTGKGYDAVLVKHGREFEYKKSNNKYIINPQVKQEFESLWSNLNLDKNITIVYLWGKLVSETMVDNCTESLIVPLLNLFSTLNKYALSQQFNMLCSFNLNNKLEDLFNEALFGFFKTVNQENPNFNIKVIALTNTSNKFKTIEKEMNSTLEEVEFIQYDGSIRKMVFYEKLPQLPTFEDKVLRNGGIYIITGGIKGVGYLISNYLAAKKHARLILVGRTPKNSNITEKIKSLEMQGAKVIYIQADVTVKTDVQRVVNISKDAFGGINGIIHSAGIIKDTFLINKKEEDFKMVIGPKMLGTINLDECTRNEKLDIFVVFSSLASIVGNVGQCDYSYGNNFLDNYALYRETLRQSRKRYGQSVSINWPFWQDGGMQISEIKKRILFEQTGLEVLKTEDGINAFLRAINAEVPQVLVTVGDEAKIKEMLSESKVIEVIDEHCEKAIHQSTSSDENKLEKIYTILRTLISEGTKLAYNKIDIHTPFEEYGMDSIMIETLISKLEQYFGKLSPTLLFEYQSVSEIAEYLVNNRKESIEKCISENSKTENISIDLQDISENTDPTPQGNNSDVGDIAIVAVNGIYPNAKNLEELWNNLQQGINCVTEIPADRWDWHKYYDENQSKANEGKIYCKWGGFIDNIDYFDAMLFNISPKEAETIDPQERLFLQNVWELLEGSGYTRDGLTKKYPKGKGADVGVFVGVTTNSYQLLGQKEWDKGNHVIPNSIPWSIPNRISFLFNLNGPSISVDTACSSSLVAVHMACESLKNKECKMAIVGGVNLYLHPSKYLAMCQLGMLSKSGKCHAFGKDADGFVPGEGVGAILLKPLRSAVEDGDEIWGVIKGSAVNHGGRTNGYKVPSPNSQAMVVKDALERANLTPLDINYIEAHGTGTSLGDPIEIEGLMQVYKDYEFNKNSCPIGSIKTNIGHGESAAGIAGLTKVLLQMKYRKLVPSLHAEQLNKHIDFESTPFYVQQELAEWSINDDNSPLRAGISAFGAGGVNAHIIVEEYINQSHNAKDFEKTQVSTKTKEESLFVFSARNKEQLNELMEKYLDLLLSKNVDLKSLAYTLQTSREEMEERLAFVVSSNSLLIEGIRNFLDGNPCISYTYAGNKNDYDTIGQEIQNTKNKQRILDLLEKHDLHKIASLWVFGEFFDWKVWYEEKEYKKLALPTYPFAKKSYWVYPKEQQPVVYLTEDWLKYELPTRKVNESNIMLVGCKKDLDYMEILERNFSNQRVCKVFLDSKNQKITKDLFEVNIMEGTPDFSVIERNKEIDTIYFLGGLNKLQNVTFDFQTYIENQRKGALALIALAKTFKRNVTIKVITNQCVGVQGKAQGDYNVFSSTLLGLSKTIPQEYKVVKLIHIDLETADSKAAALEAGLQCAVKEQFDEKYSFIAYRDGQRYLRILKKAEFIQEEVKPMLKMNGIYLILGGTGGIGTYVSKFLAKRYNAKIIIIGRSKFNLDVEKRIDSIKKFGGEVNYYSADINNIEKVMEVIRSIYEKYNNIDCVIHSAASVENCLLQNMSPNIYHKVVDMQMMSSLLLKTIAAEFGVKDYIIFSSASSYFGNQGGANYSASNSFKDTFVKYLAQNKELNIKSINWGLWSDVGLGKAYGKVLQQKFRSVIPIEATEGIKAFDKILHSNLMQVIPITASKAYLENETDCYGQREHNNEEAIAENHVEVIGKGEKQSSIKEQLITLLKNIAGANLKLDPEEIHTNVNLGDYGMDSVAGVNILNDLSNIISGLPSTLMYEFFSVAALTEYLLQEHKQDVEELFSKVPENDSIHASLEAETEENIQDKNEMSSINKNGSISVETNLTSKSRDIAIIGLDGIYPKAKNMKAFWENLINKKDCISEVPKERWNAEIYEKNHSIYCRFGGFIEGVDLFDPLFFNISPKEARGMDPQERLFLQVAYGAFLDAGYAKEQINNSRTGVFVGITNNTYQLLGLDNWNNEVEEDIPNSQSWSVANRVSYIFNLKGPSISVDTACASSLSAVHLAYESILNGDTDMALVGGVNLYLHPYKYAALCQMNMLSKTGRCRAFNDEADGFVPGEGIGAILLKPLEQALVDGDNIQGIIKATAMNHGGRTNGYTVPNPNAQAELITDALEKANINPRTISYVEAHGTGTILGDPIEISGLTTAFKKYTQDKQYCSIGSVKTNVGHLEAASGIVGITKILLQMKNKKIAPSLYTEPVNTRIDFKQTPFYIQSEVTDWKCPVLNENNTEVVYPRRASISSFGAGGCNVHVIIEEFKSMKNRSMDDGKENIILISAKTTNQVNSMARDLLSFVKDVKSKGEDEISLQNMAYTLQSGRDEMEERLAIVTDSLEDLASKLEAYLSGRKIDNSISYGRISKFNSEKVEEILSEGISLHELAVQWVSGNKISWRFLYKGNLPQKISLPLYPFVKKSLWINREILPTKVIRNQELIYPMLHYNVSNSDYTCYEAELYGNEFFIRDHEVSGSKVFPAAAYIEMVMNAVVLATKNTSIFLKNITLMKPLIFHDKPIMVKVYLDSKQKTPKFYVASDQGDKLVEKHIQGEFAPFDIPKAKLDTSNWLKLKEEGNCIKKEQIYEFYYKLGMNYGESFQRLERIFLLNNSLLAELSNDGISYTREKDYIIHPALLDGVLQSIVGFAFQNVAQVQSLPFYIGAIEILDKKKQWRYVYVSKSGDKLTKYDMVILDEEGEHLVYIRDLSVRPIHEKNTSSKIEEATPSIEKAKQLEQSDGLISDLRKKVSYILELDIDDIDDDTELGDYGFDSLTFTDFCDLVNKEYNLMISPAILFEYPTIRTLAEYLKENFQVDIKESDTEKYKFVEGIGVDHETEIFEGSLENSINNTCETLRDDSTTYRNEEAGDFPVAIIGMAGKMPQCDGLEEFWENIIKGKNLITEIPNDRWKWQEYYGDPIKQKNKTLAKWGGFIKDVDKFDAQFFNISAREAELMDPQQRIMLQLAWSTVENAGYSISSLNDSKTGVFIGVAANTEYNDLLNKNMEETEAYQSTGVATSVLVNRISYIFNWHGPSEPVDTACSSSFVAIHRAIESIRNGDCNIALAGGTNLILTPKGSISFGKSGLLSIDGQCKTFDKSANGYVRSEGMGLVLLKPLKQAQLDKDHIYGVIRGSAVNHGGKGNSITSPNPNAQAEVIIKAFEKAKVDITTIDYIETHGTGTQLGDAVEINGLKKAFKIMGKANGIDSIPNYYCGLSSVKPNVGHLETAAGMASLFKVLLSFKYHQLPPLIHFKELNPNINLENSPFYIVHEKKDFKDKPLRVGISSFGFGGVNSHLVLEEYIDNEVQIALPNQEHLIILSAKDKDRLTFKAKQLEQLLEKKFSVDAEENLTAANIQQQLKHEVGDILGIDEEEVAPQLPFLEMGFDKVTLNELKQRIKILFDLELHLSQIVEMESVLNLSKYLNGANKCEKSVTNNESYLQSMAYTLQVGRDEMEERVAWKVQDISELVNKLKGFCSTGKAEYYGRVCKRSSMKTENSKDIIMDALIRKDYDFLAGIWVEGARIDWKLLYDDKVISKIELPTYPFYKKLYWFNSKVSNSNLDYGNDSMELEIIESDLKEFKYKVKLDSLYSLLADHAIEGKVLLPGAFCFELMRLVAQKHFNRVEGLRITNVYWSTPYVLENIKENSIYISLNDNKNTKVKVMSVTNGSILEHFQTEISFTENILSKKSIMLSQVEESCKGSIDCSQLYDEYLEHGFCYGKSFRTVTRLLYSSEEVLSYLVRKDSFNWKCYFHPAIIDGAFQSIAGVQHDSDNQRSNKAYLPFSLKSFCAYDAINDECFAYIKERGNKEDFRQYDILIVNKSGKVVAEFENFGLKGFEAKQSKTLYFIPEYVNSQCFNSEKTSKPVIIIDGADDFRDLLQDVQNTYWVRPSDKYYKTDKARYEANLYESNDIEAVVSEALGTKYKELTILISVDCLMEEQDDRTAFFKIFYLTKALLRKYYHTSIQFLLVYKEADNNIAKRALASYARTLNLENVNFSFKLMEYDFFSPQILVKEVFDKFSGCLEIRYKDEVRYQKQLREINIKDNKTLLKQNGVYVLVGGSGGLGRILAKHLLKKYKATVIMVSRSPLKEVLLNELKKYEEFGGKALHLQADITDLKECEACFSRLRQEFNNINGIFHLAGALNDSLIFRKDATDIAKVLGAKVKGVYNLDTVTSELDLEVFCVFSSITSVTGNVGQADYAYANGYLDEFVNWRNRKVKEGLQSGYSCSINWPLWEDGGMQVDEKVKERLQKENGLEILKASDGMDIFERIMASGYSQVIPLKGNIEHIQGSLTAVQLYNLKKEEDSSINIQHTSGHNGKEDISKVSEDMKKKIADDLTKVFSEILKIDPKEIDCDEDLEMYGFDSLMMVEVLSRIESLYDIYMDPSVINEYKNINNLAEYISNNSMVKEIKTEDLRNVTKVKEDKCKEAESDDSDYDDKIAVIGMSCRFPQSRNVQEYWDNLLNEKDLITEVPKERWNIEKYYDREMKQKNSTCSKWGGFLEEIEKFDAKYWGITDLDALIMDPQQRILLELVEELWCDSGYRKENVKGQKVGVFIGAAESSYLKNNFDKVPPEVMKHVVVSTISNMIAARISDTYDLQGPSFTIDTACSSSLVSIHEACMQMRNGSCDMAIAGGVQLLLDPIDHIGLSQAGVLTPERKAYVFDERAKGIVIGEGAGVVLLKPLKNAVKDGDKIHAVIMGSAINNDGHTMGLTTPNIEGQKKVIRQAIKNSGISPDTISYYEAHGTGTLLGDPIEIRAATQVYKEFSDEVQFCGVSSVKANMGHLLRASGIASFIKVVMTIEKGMMAKTINCEKPHPRFNFPNSTFYPVTENKAWYGIDGYKRAAISSFGFGGTNCHMILEDFNRSKYPEYQLKRYPINPPIYDKKVYWLGKEIGQGKKEFYNKLLLKLRNEEITPEEAVSLETEFLTGGLKQI